VDIDKGLGHAIKLLVRLLKGAEEPYGLRLTSLAGGTASNAIPREASAIAFLPPDQVDAFTAYVKDYEATIQSELAATEPDLKATLEAVQPPARVMDQEFQTKLINALYGTPQGVTRMSDAIPGLVETSNNLGVAAIQDGQMQLVAYSRSAIDSALLDIGQMVASVWELAGYPIEVTDRFGAWTPDPDSPIVALMQSTYQELFGVEPEISAVHAGVECSTIGSKYPQMEMISIGPYLDKVHSPSERLYIPSVEKVSQLLAATLQKIPEK
jgi:dipeptidase D